MKKLSHFVMLFKFMLEYIQQVDHTVQQQFTTELHIILWWKQKNITKNIKKIKNT